MDSWEWLTLWEEIPAGGRMEIGRCAMGDKSNIEWTEATWNPTTGCTKVSPGCLNCYIDRTPPFRIAHRKFSKGHIPLQLHDDKLDKPLHWKRPRLIFVNSLSDLFHDDVPDHFILKVFDVMRQCVWSGGQSAGTIGGRGHIFQLLTKRPKRMRDFMARLRWDGERLLLDEAIPGQLDSMMQQIWLGVSVENRQHGLPRIEELRETKASIRWLSIEPLLEDLGDIMPFLADVGFGDCSGCTGPRNERTHQIGTKQHQAAKIDWVVVGGESGPGARPMHPSWIRSIRDQCQAAQIPFFFKQHGDWIAINDYSPFWHGQDGSVHNSKLMYRDGTFHYPFLGRESFTDELPVTVYQVGKKLAGRELDGRYWNESPVSMGDENLKETW